MPKITLPDGSAREFDNAVTVMQVAEDIGPGLAKATLAGKVDGELVDASFEMQSDSVLEIITSKSLDGLEVIRHSTAHLLAQAVKQLYPKVQVTIGPVIENGFYYDFSKQDGFAPEDLDMISVKMQELVKAAQPVTRSEMSRDDAIKYFEDLGETYKAEIIRDIPEDQILSLYTQGGFTDLCRGPHVPNTSKLGVFKLMSVAGAYWRGNSNNEMLQRIYGTAFADKKELKAHLLMLEEAMKRDHRKLGKKLDLYHMQEEAPGQVFWHENGWHIWQAVEAYIRQMQKDNGFAEIKTPLIADLSLWEASGHQAKYSANMFTTSSENRDYALKPMNCPCHVQVFKQGVKSHRDLPIRFAEFGSCHRNEPSGALHGLMRVRGFVQDDAHVFCLESHIQDELKSFLDSAFKLYKDFGFKNVAVKLATRPEERIGDDATWDKAEADLAAAMKAAGVEYEVLEGEGAFYGPKLEMHLTDCIGRSWQCGTFQLDFYVPERLGATYIDENSQKKTPVMLHIATIGSFERFIGMLIEHYEGKFPTWLAPTQVVVMGVSERHNEYVKSVTKSLNNEFRAKNDLRNEKIGFKIREHTLMRVPFQLIVGDKEVENNTVSVRTISGEDLGSMSVDALKSILRQTIEGRN